MGKHADTTSRQLKIVPPVSPPAKVDDPENPDVDVIERVEHAHRRSSATGAAVAACVVVVSALVGVGGWLTYRVYENRQTRQDRDMLVQVARQGAMNLTTIDYTQAEADVQRILDSSTGTFHDDFAKRVQPFIDVVKLAQSKSEGTVTAAGLESVSGDQAQVLVSVSVRTSNAAAVEQDPRLWRMRISVQQVGGVAKVSNVEFVP